MRTINRLLQPTHYNLLNQLLQMLDRPRFVFEEEDENEEGIEPSRQEVNYNASIGAFKKEDKVEGRKGAGLYRKGGNAGTRTTVGLNSHNPELLAPSTRTNGVRDVPPSTQKQKQKLVLKYRQLESHIVNSNISPENDPQKAQKILAQSDAFETKMTSHLEDAKQMKPNHFFKEDNQSPLPQPHQKLVIAPALPPTSFDPYKYAGLGRQKRSKNKDYQIFLEPTTKANKKLSKNQSIETNNQSNINNSSHIVLNNSSVKQTEEILDIPATEDSQTKLRSALYEVPSQSYKSYNFSIDRRFGVNYMYPDYKICSEEGEVLISAKKEAFHINSHYNIYAGEIKDENKIGYVKGSFGGTEFNVFQVKEQSEQLICTIIHKAQLTCAATFRKIDIYLKDIKVDNPALNRRSNLQEQFESGDSSSIIKLVTKQPTWREDLQAYTMNFNGKSKMNSTKNMILVDQKNPRINSLLFCKQNYGQFYMEMASPLNLITCISILITNFDFKLLCQ